MNDKIIAYKGFTSNMRCRGYQFEEGKEYDCSKDEDIELCRVGFHACTDPIDCFTYYLPNNNSIYHKVELSGIIKRASDDSKICASHIKILEEVSSNEILAMGKEKAKNIMGDRYTDLEYKFVGTIKSKRDINKLLDTTELNVGNKILIIDGEYNKNFICVEKEKLENGKYGYYFLALDYFELSCMDDEYKDNYTSFKETMLSRKLDSISYSFEKVLGSRMKEMEINDNGLIYNTKLTLPTQEQVCKDQKYDKTNFQYFRLRKILNLWYDQYFRGNFWLRGVASSSHFAIASGSGYASYSTASDALWFIPLLYLG